MKLSLLALATVSLLSFGCGGEGEVESPPPSDVPETGASATAPRAKRYPTEAATVADVTQPLLLTGRVVPLQQATISSQVPGLVLPTDKLLQEGKFYRKGETMAIIDAEPLELSLKAARAEFVSSVVRLLPTLANDHPRAYPTYKAFVDGIDPGRPLPPLPEASTDTLRYYLAANGIAGQYYRIEAQEATLDDYVIRAPFSGKLTSAQLEPGAIVQPGQQLATLSRTDVYEVRAAVPAAAADQLAPGQKVDFYARNLGRRYRGTVNRFATAVDPTTQTQTAFVRVSGPGLASGMYLEAELAGRTLDGVSVLPKQVLTRDGKVYVVADSVVQAKAVEVALVESDKVYLRGLSPGDRVITSDVQGEIVGTRAL